MSCCSMLKHDSSDKKSVVYCSCLCDTRELDKGGSAAASMWASRPTEHRSMGSTLTSYGGPSDWKTMRSKLICLKLDIVDRLFFNLFNDWWYIYFVFIEPAVLSRHSCHSYSVRFCNQRLSFVVKTWSVCEWEVDDERTRTLRESSVKQLWKFVSVCSQYVAGLLTLWRPLLPYGFSYKSSCASIRVPGCQKLQMTA